MTEEINQESMAKMNNFFKKNDRCGITYHHTRGDCVYTGTIGDRWRKYQQLEAIRKAGLVASTGKES